MNEQHWFLNNLVTVPVARGGLGLGRYLESTVSECSSPSSPQRADWPARRRADLRVLQLEGNLEIALKDV
jgi:hypothetical protein